MCLQSVYADEGQEDSVLMHGCWATGPGSCDDGGCVVVLYGARVLCQTLHGASHAVMVVCMRSCDEGRTGASRWAGRYTLL
jgi:hypothetical protein